MTAAGPTNAPWPMVAEVEMIAVGSWMVMKGALVISTSSMRSARSWMLPTAMCSAGESGAPAASGQFLNGLIVMPFGVDPALSNPTGGVGSATSSSS